MTMCYSYTLFLLFLLLITHWTNAASLHFPSNFSIMSNEYFKIETRHSQIPLHKRLKRWTINEDNDEVEIPLNESISSVNNTSVNPIATSTLLNFETIESDSSIIEQVNDMNNSTNAYPINKTTFEIQFDENTTIIYPLLRKDLTELNQTISSYVEDVIQNNNTNFYSTISEDFVSNSSNTLVTALNQVLINNNKNESIIDPINNLTDKFEFSTSVVPFNLNQTTDQIKSVTTVILHDSITISYNTSTDNRTNDWNLSFNDKTETYSDHNSSTITTLDEFLINSNISQKNAIITLDQEIHINDTESICDTSCLCLKECLYGFEILNDTCLCDPPCKNYQCFHNDICITTDEGHPLCQPENGTEHDRPSRCYQPRDAGFHDIDIGYYNRWYYNPDQDTCHLFVYRGMGGNENNFRTLHECHSECITCAPLPDAGECLGHVDMWYYDYKTSECREFEYSGCKGNDNKFMKKKQCIDTCINRITNVS